MLFKEIISEWIPRDGPRAPKLDKVSKLKFNIMRFQERRAGRRYYPRPVHNTRNIESQENDETRNNKASIVGEEARPLYSNACPSMSSPSSRTMEDAAHRRQKEGFSFAEHLVI